MVENAAALRDGEFDVVQVFEPHVEQLVSEGVGHIWYAAATRGPTSYTTLYTTRRLLTEQRETALAMTRAIYRTQKWLHAHDPATVAATVAPFFQHLKIETLTTCISRYKKLGLWGRNPVLPREGFERLKAACLSSGRVKTGTAFEDCVDTSLAKAVIESDPPSM